MNGVIGVFLRLLRSLKVPAWCHHLFHKQRCSNCFQKIVHSHLHVRQVCIRHGYHVDKASSVFALAVTGTTTDNLNDLSQRTTHTHGEAGVTPLPVESFLGCAQCDDEVHIICLLHLAEIGVDSSPCLRVIIHKVSQLHSSAILSLQCVNATTVVVITLHHSANKFHNVFHLLIFSSCSACPTVDTWNVDDGLTVSIKHLADMVEIRAFIEVIAQHKILQILVAIELLIVVVAHGTEACLVLCTKHRNTIATEIAACHGYNMPSRVVHHTADCIAQSAVCISTSMVKLVNSQQTVVPVLIIQFLHGIT